LSRNKGGYEEARWALMSWCLAPGLGLSQLSIEAARRQHRAGNPARENRDTQKWSLYLANNTTEMSTTDVHYCYGVSYIFVHSDPNK